MINDILAHLQASVGGFNRIELAWALEPVEDLKGEVPLLMVYPGADKGAANDFDGITQQKVTRHIELLFVDTVANLEASRKAVQQQLLGFQVGDDWLPCQFVQGDVQGIRGSHIWWRDIYMTAEHLRSS